MPLLEVNNNLVTLLCMTSVWPLCMVLPKIAVRMTMHLCQSLPFTVLQTVHKHSISLLYLSALCYVPAKSRKRASLVPINAPTNPRKISVMSTSHSNFVRCPSNIRRWKIPGNINPKSVQQLDPKNAISVEKFGIQSTTMPERSTTQARKTLPT